MSLLLIFGVKLYLVLFIFLNIEYLIWVINFCRKYDICLEASGGFIVFVDNDSRRCWSLDEME